MEKRYSHVTCAAVCSTAAAPFMLLYRCYCKRYGNGVVYMAGECLKGKKVMLREQHLSQTLTCVIWQKPWRKFFFIHNLMGIFSFDLLYLVYIPSWFTFDLYTFTWFVHVHILFAILSRWRALWNAATLWSEGSVEREHATISAQKRQKFAIHPLNLSYIGLGTSPFGNIYDSKVSEW